MIEYLRDVANNWGMLAYVTKSNYKKNSLQNYLTVLIDSSYMTFFSSNYSTIKMYMYSFESLLTQSRMYQALMNLKNLSIGSFVLNPKNFPMNYQMHKNSAIMANYLEKNKDLFN